MYAIRSYYAIASELVKFDNQYAGIINSLLGRIVIAENIELGTLISKKFGYKFKIVTLDGQVINAGGSFTGGSSSRSSGVLTRKNEIELIKIKLGEFSEINENLKNKTGQLQAEVDKIVIDIEAVKEIMQTLNSDKIRFESEIKHLSVMIEQMDTKASENKRAMDNFEKKLELYEKDLINDKNLLIQCENEISEKEGVVSQNQSQKDLFHANREALSEKLSSLKIKQTEIIVITSYSIHYTKLYDLILQESFWGKSKFHSQMKQCLAHYQNI